MSAVARWWIIITSYRVRSPSGQAVRRARDDPAPETQQPFEAGAIRGRDAHAGMQREAAAMAPAGKVGCGFGGEGAMVDRDTQHPAADPALHGADRGGIEIGGGMEVQRAVRADAEHPVGDATMQVGVGVERRAKTLHETDGAKAGVARCTETAASQCRLERAQ
jgi:hypothetical protein